MALDKVSDEIGAGVPAPCPKGGMIRLRIGQERIRQLAGLHRKTALFELLYNVCGIVPPVSNIGHHEGYPTFPDSWGGVKHTHTIFKGVKRPLNTHGLDGDVYVYIVLPKYTYSHVTDSVCAAKRCDAPRNSVFAVYVLFEDDELHNGRIVNWEWIVADEGDPAYPKNFNQRYDEKVWSNG